MLKISVPPPLAAFLSGILMGLVPAPSNLWPLAWVALIPLWVFLCSLPSTDHKLPLASRPAPLAFFWGLGYHGLALSWITHLHPLTWLGIPWLGSLAIATACWIFISLWGAAMVVLWGWLFRRILSFPASLPAILRVLIGTVLWCSLEGLWSLGPLYWTSLSYTQSPANLVILHLGRLSGPFTVTAAIVAVNGLLAEAWMQHRRLGGRDQQPRAMVLLMAAIALFISSHLIGWGLYRQPLADQPASALRVGMIQGNISNEVKLGPEGLRQANRQYRLGYEQLAAEGVDAVLMPEGALPLIWGDEVQRRNPVYQAVVANQVPVWMGTFVPQNSRITQSLLTLIGTETDPYSRYNKVKLVPLGEYIPFEKVLGGLINRLSSLEFGMVPGGFDQRFDTPFGRAAVGICYDSAFANLFRVQIANGAQFILTASNNDPYPHAMMLQHHAQDVMRAIESDRWVARATNTGYSSVIDPHGETVWISARNQYTLHADTLYRRQTRTLYVRWGNWLIPVLALTAGAGYWFRDS